MNTMSAIAKSARITAEMAAIHKKLSMPNEMFKMFEDAHKANKLFAALTPRKPLEFLPKKCSCTLKQEQQTEQRPLRPIGFVLNR